MKVVGIMIFIVLLVSCATTGNEERLQKASAHYQLGVSYMNDNNIQPAFVEFQKAIELNPDDKESLNAIGLIYLLKLEDYPRAIEYFERALRIDKSFSEAFNNLGYAYEKMERFNDAIIAYKSALLNPLYKSAEKAFNNLGRAYYRLKRYSEAIEAYKESLRRFSGFHLPYYGLALCYNAIGRYGDAATSLKKAVELDPSYNGDRDKALNDMKEKRLLAKGYEERDLSDLIEIFNY
jgi:tetratricopeptide (TPR) repeat protein